MKAHEDKPRSDSFYQDHWDRYYQSVMKNPEMVIWDVEPGEACEKDLRSFGSCLTADRPVVDLACGTGTQTVCLAKTYPQVLGFDVSPAVIEQARQRVQLPNVSFQVFDATDVKAAGTVHEQWGDVHIYMRGILHQLRREDSRLFAETASTLLGREGVLYCTELTPRAKIRLAGLLNHPACNRDALNRILRDGITPFMGVGPEQVYQFFPLDLFHIIEQGESTIHTCYGPDLYVDLPARYVLAKNQNKV